MTTPTFNEDDRFQIEFTAQQAERRNRSMRLVVLGLLVLVVCSFVWIWGWSAKSRALTLLRSQQTRQAQIETMLVRIESLRDQGIDKSAGGEPITGMGTKLRDIAVAAGVPGSNIPVPDESTENVTGGRLKFYYYENVTSPTLDPLLAWLRSATDERQGIEGLELYSLTIEPDTTRKHWSVDVRFRRWEKTP